MKRFISVLIVVFFAAIPFNGFAKGLRIVSLAPSITEILFALGAGDMVVADTLFSNYPEAAKRLPKVGSYAHPSLEKIAALHPDYVIGMKEGPSRDVAIKLKEMGIRCKFYSAKSVDDIIWIIKDISRIVHKNPEPLIERIKALYNHLPPPKATAVFLVSLKPLIAATNNTFIDSIMACAGLRNIVHNSSLEFIILDREYLLENQPDCIIVSIRLKNVKEMAERLIKELHLRSHLLVVDPDIFNRPSYRVVQACLSLRKMLR